jgi:hypothetical protein
MTYTLSLNKMALKNDRVAAVVIFIATFAVFKLCPIHTITDSQYEMFFGQQLLWHHSFSVDPGALPEFQSHPLVKGHEGRPDFNYRLYQVGDRLYYSFPPGTVILSAPFIAVANAIGISAADRNGMYDPRGEERIQSRLAALLMAGLSLFVFLTSRLVLPLNWSLLITAATAFGTQVWSIASRAMWTHTWGIFILGFVIWLVLRTETKSARLHPVWLATCLSWLYFVRPTFSLSIIAISIYVLIYHRRDFLPLVLTGGLWLAAFVAFSQYHFGQNLPAYFRDYSRGNVESFGQAFSANLVSPSRGLFVYVPIVGFVIYLAARYGTRRKRFFLACVALVSLFQLVVISDFLPWHAGHSYGARLLVDLVPWFALLAILAVEARLRWGDENRARDSVLRQRTEWSFAIVLLACSMALNGVAAMSSDVWRWNTRPDNIDLNPARVWDWRHPQFLGVPREAIIPARESVG